MQSLKLQPIQWGILALVAVTAVIHLVLGITLPAPLFILNAVGYVGLAGLLYLPIAAAAPYRTQLRWALIGYTLVTIILFFVFNGADAFSSIPGLLTKAVEVVLVVLLWWEGNA